MATTLPNMGLVKWDLTGDPYSHTQLAANFQAIDDHDHTSGKGKLIVTNSITNLAVTSAKLADGSVTTAKLADGSVTAAKLANDAKYPIGIVVPWWRPDASVPVPTGWIVPIGQTLTDPEHDFAYVGSIVVPDMRNAFVLGAATSGTGTGTGTPPAIGAVGGSHTLNLAHAHSVNSHTHSVPDHVHSIDAHSHTVSDHAHTVPTQADHAHTYNSGNQVYSRQANTTYKQPPTGLDDFLQTLFINNFNSGGGAAAAPMDPAGSHNHGGATGGVTAPVSTGSTALNTTSSGSSTTGGTAPGTDSQLSSAVDGRGAFVGLLYIMKVMY